MRISTSNWSFVVALVAVVILPMASGCIAKRHRVVPVANPAEGTAPGQELRIPNKDERFRADCKKVGDFYCMDLFWRVEQVEADQVVFRYRIVSPTKEGARARQDYIDKITLVTEDGRTFPAKLSERFEVDPLPPMNYSDEGRVKTGRTQYQRRADGTVIEQDETTIGTVTRSVDRFLGINYVVFEGDSIITADTKKVSFSFPEGLLGGGAEWVFHFEDVQPVNAEIATEPQTGD